jgi:2-keto-3-deoxy-L-rhamnonate aldolase RhmA
MRELLQEGRPLIGGHAMFADPAYVEFLGYCDFDWIFIDGEHLGTSVQGCYELVRAADAVGMASVVRVPTSDAHPHIGFAETGVNALMIPHLVTAQDAVDLKSSLRFPPLGTRGISGNTRTANYGLGHTAREYLEDLDSAIMTAAMIEEEAAVRNLPEIIATGGVELYSIGTSDLAGSMGLSGQTNDPRVVEMYELAVKTLADADQVFSCPAATPEAAQSAIAKGARLILASTPQIIGARLSSFAAACR